MTYVIPDTYNDVQHWEFPLFGLKMLRLLHVLARNSRQIVFSVQCGAFGSSGLLEFNYGVGELQ